MKYLISLSIALTLFNSVCLADDVPSEITTKLKEVMGTAPDSVKPTPIANIFEVRFNNEIIYTTSDAEYVFSGQLVNLKTKQSLTNKALNDFNKETVSKINKDTPIEFKAKGEEKYVLYAFVDIECPYCQKLHKEVPALNEKGVTVRYLAYPRQGIDSATAKNMAAVWCASDKTKALNEAMTQKTEKLDDNANKETNDELLEITKNLNKDNKLVEQMNKAMEKGKSSEEKMKIAQAFMQEHKAEFDKMDKNVLTATAKTDTNKADAVKANDNCLSIIEEHYKIGKSVGVSGTPSLLTLDGERIEGYMPAAQLIERLAKGNK